ncbi:putative molybdenum carrier protein [Lignipirellula cremea]|uniref:Molybdenum carrier n=1 Tax=Lignipirellula cremea TaxID=2528010 RepID=A0A518E3Q5_9BACT|nr:putative molybdenum carrier protein [Lignipirellula cremea]QDU98719.1 Putative molybdenum carrier [Lignipirellula cremea]
MRLCTRGCRPYDRRQNYLAFFWRETNPLSLFFDHLQIQVVSGGQTGVDRAALDAAIQLDLPHGGWCPRGRLAEDGPLPPHYQLRESRSANYAVRTRKNVVDSDGTLILYRGEMTGGTDLTRRLARQHHRPCLPLDLAGQPSPDRAAAWVIAQKINVLNIAGPRESSCPGVYQQALDYCRQLLERLV